MQTIDFATFEPHHIHACREDFLGNGDVGRYVFIPGSNDRAQSIADKYFTNVVVRQSKRGHHLYLGDMEINGKTFKVASISTGMGTPSVDLILSELIILGAKRFLRVGTAGSMQPDVRVGDVVFATASVRDESTSVNYVPYQFPAVASLDFTCAANNVRKEVDYRVRMGVVHTKDSLFAREFLCGPSGQDSISFVNKMKAYGVMATEMESSHIFVLSKIYAKLLGYSIKSGCVLGVIGDDDPFSNDKEAQDLAIQNAVDFGVRLIKNMAAEEVA